MSVATLDRVTVEGHVSPGFGTVREVFTENFARRDELGGAWICRWTSPADSAKLLRPFVRASGRKEIQYCDRVDWDGRNACGVKRYWEWD